MSSHAPPSTPTAPFCRNPEAARRVADSTRQTDGPFGAGRTLFSLALAILLLLAVPNLPGAEPVRIDIEKTIDRVQDGIVAYYPFREGEGFTTADRGEVVTPLDLRLSDGVDWIPGRNGVRFFGQGALVGHNARKLSTAIRSSREFTLEFWCKQEPSNRSQSLISFTSGSAERNLWLGTSFGRLTGGLVRDVPVSPVMRSRFNSFDRLMYGLVSTTESRPTGGWAAVAYLHKRPSVHHYVLRFADETAKFYRDGQVVSERELVGTTAEWELDDNLFVGNDFDGKSPWRGELYLLAVYSRALSANEVRINFAAGNRIEASPAEEPPSPAARVPGNPPGGPVEPAPENRPPMVDAGPDRTVWGTHAGVELAGAVEDDGLPHGQLDVTWKQLEGPDDAIFEDQYIPGTRVECKAYGRYVLELTASDGEMSTSDTLTLMIEPGEGQNARVTQDLIAFYPFREGDGGVALDESEYGAPLDLELSEGVSWLPGRWGVELAKGSVLESAAAEKIHQAVTASNAFSFEVWAKPLNDSQGGPARLVSNSSDAHNRNFTLGPRSRTCTLGCGRPSRQRTVAHTWFGRGQWRSSRNISWSRSTARCSRCFATG